MIYVYGRVYNQTHASDAAPAEDMNTPGDISDIDVFDDLERGQGKVFTLSCLMRGFGTRLENTVKNTGMRGFAFNLIQRKCFPDLYRFVTCLICTGYWAATFYSIVLHNLQHVPDLHSVCQM